MPKFTDLTGKNFNQYTVIRRSPNRGTKVYWLCQCSCGNLRDVRSQGLTSGTQKSCGHGFPEIQRKRQCIECGLSAKRSAYRNYKNQAKRKEREFDLNFNDFISITSLNCHYCDTPPLNLYRGDNGNFKYQGIDRKNNDIGYTLENLVPCCEICNKAKRNMSYGDFILWLQKVANHHTWT